QHWNARAEGHVGGRAKAAPIEAAIAAYQKAVTQDPNNLEARWKLLRAMRFKGAYVGATNVEKKNIYAGAKTAGEAAIAVVNRALAAKGVKSNAPEKQIAEAARTIPGAGEVFFWDSVNWGEWALAYGKMADALVSNDSKNGPEAIRILREVINSPNDPNYEVESAQAQEDAKALLREWGA